MMTQQIKFFLSNMKSYDISNVVKIESMSFGDHHWSEDAFENELQNELAHYYVVKNDDGEILGFIGFWLIFEEAHVTTLCVHPDYRKNNIASVLINEMIKCCYKNMVKFITLEVRVSNIPAITLYEKFGFYSVGIRKAYYQNNNEDAMIMFTNNIFYSQFKNVYDKIRLKLEEIEVVYEETLKK